MKAGLIWPRGRVHMSNRSSPVFRECCFFTRRFCKKQTSILSRAHRFKHIALLKGMLNVNNTAYIVQKYWLFWKGYGSFEKRATRLEMHTALLQRAWCNCSRNTSCFLWILSLQNHTALPQRKITLYSEGYVCLQVWGCCNSVEVM